MAEVFLSHNSADKPWVRQLYAELQRRGVTDLFFDEFSLYPGDRLVHGLAEGLTGTLVFILVWSAKAAASHWVSSERDLAFVQNVSKGLPLFLPILIDGTLPDGFDQIFVHLKARTDQQPDGLSLPELAAQITRTLAHARRKRGN